LVAIGKRETLWRYGRVGYASFQRDGHIENYRVLSPEFEDFLADKYGELHQREINGDLAPCYPDDEHLKKAIHRIEAFARRSPERKPRIRVTEFEGELWIDLGTPDWSAIVINAKGRRIEPEMRAPLIRGAGMRPLPIPVEEGDGDIQELRPFVNLRVGEEGDVTFVLLCGAMAAMLSPFANYLTHLLSGPPNSAKSSMTRIMRALTDPHEIESRFLAKPRDLKHGAENTHVIGIENMRHLNEEWSNLICVLNTGAGYGERKLYAQGEEHRAYLHCPVIINGIPANIVDQPDLLDRIITFRFDFLGDKVRSDEGLKRKFTAAAPRLFGALLDGLVNYMKVRQQYGGDVDLAAADLLGGWHPRFVDTAVCAEAACQGMDFKPSEFTGAYRANKEVVFQELAEYEPICVGIRILMFKQDEWRGYPAELCAAIGPYVAIPVTPNWLGRDLPYFIPTLSTIYGIEVTMNNRLHKDGNRTGIIITRRLETVGGRYFPDSPVASGEKENATPSSNSSPTAAGKVGTAKVPFPRRF
jgi:hypothetical protein